MKLIFFFLLSASISVGAQPATQKFFFSKDLSQNNIYFNKYSDQNVNFVFLTRESVNVTLKGSFQEETMFLICFYLMYPTEHSTANAFITIETEDGEIKNKQHKFKVDKNLNSIRIFQYAPKKWVIILKHYTDF